MPGTSSEAILVRGDTKRYLAAIGCVRSVGPWAKGELAVAKRKGVCPTFW